MIRIRPIFGCMRFYQHNTSVEQSSGSLFTSSFRGPL